jgi:hypothetical protein
MDDIDLTNQLVDYYKISPGKIGRYSVSSVWGIVNGYTTVSDFLSGQTVTALAALRMSNGRWKHAQVQELLPKDFNIETKKEITVHDFVLVGRVDFMTDDTVYEIKTKSSVMDKAKSWHMYQAKLYCTMFEKNKASILQPIIFNHRLILKNIGNTKRDDQWFSKQMDKLLTFHESLKTKETINA